MSSIVISGDSSGAITLAAPSVAGTNTITLPAGTGTAAVQGVSTNIVSGISQASTSGTSIDFTGIPSWAKRITVMFSGVSTNGTSFLQIQLGTGSTPTYTTSGYSAVSSNVATSGGTGGNTATTGFVIATSNASSIRHGHMILTPISGNTWVSSHVIGDAGINFTAQGGGNVGLSATLTAVRITTINGTDTFDAGSINILYE